MKIATEKVPAVVANFPCCICGAESSQSFFERRYDKFSYSGKFHMRRCDGCGLLFCSPRLSDEGIADLYDANYYVFRKADADYFARTSAVYQRTVAMLPNNTLGKSVLEVGSGKGYLLAVLGGLGWEAFGVEISVDAVAYAQKSFGIDGYAGTIDKYLATGYARQFPVVLCIDILEHVTDPARFVSKLVQVTEVGGYVVIDTPNADSARAAQEGSGWRGFNPFHIFVFGAANLARLLVANGFLVELSFSYNNGGVASTEDGFIDLESCVEACRKTPSYFQNPDADGPYARDLRGENLIVIARRVL